MTVGDHLPLPTAVAWCVAQTVIVVASLHVLVPANVRQLDREDARQIQHRMLAFVLATLVCYAGTSALLKGTGQHIILAHGLSVQSTLAPLLSFVLLFAGQLAQVFVFPAAYGYEQHLNYADGQFWVNVRNLCFAPVPEELVFRSLMGSTLLAVGGGGISRTSVLFGTPLFFGLAHVHLSVVKWWRAEGDARVLALGCLFQVAYTTVFGALMMHVLLRTENVLAVVLIHCFCNLCGFPNLAFWKTTSQGAAAGAVVGACYVAGVAQFIWWWWW